MAIRYSKVDETIRVDYQIAKVADGLSDPLKDQPITIEIIVEIHNKTRIKEENIEQYQ